jgi:hypothetical protein
MMCMTAQNQSRLLIDFYGNTASALHHTKRFLIGALSPRQAHGIGIVWLDSQGTSLLQAPTFDTKGHGLAVVFQYRGPIRPEHVPPKRHGAVRTTYDAVYDFFAAGTRDAYQTVHNAIVDHPDIVGAVNVGLDLVTTGETVVALLGEAAVTVPLVTSVFGVAALPLDDAAMVTTASALGASAALLVADGKDLGLRLFEGQKVAEKYETGSEFYARTEQFGPLIAIIDPLREATRVLQAGRSVKAAEAAVQDATKAADAARAANNMADAAAADAKAGADRVSNYLAQPGRPVTQEGQALMQRRAAASAAASRQASAAAAKTAETLKNLDALKKKADALTDIINDYTRVGRLHHSALRESVATNFWAIGNYAFNNPFSAYSGKPVGLAAMRNPTAYQAATGGGARPSPWLALVPDSLLDGRGRLSMSEFVHYMTLRVVAVSSPIHRAH